MPGHRVRIAQRGWNVDRPAETIEDVQVGIGVLWVEIDGTKFDAVVRAEVVADNDEVSLPRLVLDLVGKVEIVYCNDDGEEFRGTQPHAFVGSTPVLDHEAVMERER